MQPRSDDRFILYLAVCLEAMEDDQTEVGRGVHMPAGVSSRAECHESPAGQEERKVSRITRRAILEHPLLAPRFEQLYFKTQELNTTVPNSLKKFNDESESGERSSALIVKGRVK